MSDASEQQIKIAVLESEIRGLREQHKAHKDDITKSLSDLADKVFDAISGIRTEIKDIYAFINRSKGGIAALVLLASAIGGAVTAILTHILK
ncbi:MAG: hypothetical protein WCL30_04990 [Pseudomonadota bacterium]